LVANTILQGTVENCVNTFKARNKQHWNFTRIAVVISVNKQLDKMGKE